MSKNMNAPTPDTEESLRKSADRVYLSMIVLGLGYLAPYNSVLTASDYFQDKFGTSVEYYLAAALVRRERYFRPPCFDEPTRYETEENNAKRSIRLLN